MRQPSKLYIHSVVGFNQEKLPEEDYVFPPLTHHELIFYFGGKRQKRFGNTVLEEQGYTLEYLPYTGQREEYRVHISAHGDCIDIFFDADVPLFDAATAFTDLKSGEIGSSFEKMLGIRQRREPGWENRCMGLLYGILGEIQRLEAPTYVPVRRQQRIAPAIAYIEAHFAEPEPDLACLPGLCGMSYSYFKRIFKEIYGTAPLAYVTALRLRMAADYLASGRFSVEETAAATGFASPWYFSRVFKKHYGVPPSEYKRI